MEITLIVFFVFLIAFAVGYLIGIKIVDSQKVNPNVRTVVTIEG